MVTFVPLLTAEIVAALPERSQEVVEYRKSGQSLNHVQGCPLGCAYCIRHTYGLWDANTPAALMTDAEAVAARSGDSPTNCSPGDPGTGVSSSPLSQGLAQPPSL